MCAHPPQGRGQSEPSETEAQRRPPREDGVRRHGSRISDRVVRILAWVSLQSCKGYLIVDLSPQCWIRQVYGRGECELGGETRR